MHRSALQKALVSGALGSGAVTLHLSKLVSDINFEQSSFLVQNRSSEGGSGKAEAEWVKADVILAADGVKSKARGAMMARHGQVDSGKSPSRFVINSK